MNNLPGSSNQKSSYLRSSLEGALQTLKKVGSGNFDSPFEPGSLTHRPSKPKMDPFKKFENFSLGQRSSREDLPLSGRSRLQSQHSNSSLTPTGAKATPPSSLQQTSSI
jgi:hypothetical protein